MGVVEIGQYNLEMERAPRRRGGKVDTAPLADMYVRYVQDVDIDHSNRERLLRV